MPSMGDFFFVLSLVSKNIAFCWKNRSCAKVAAKMNQDSFARAGPTAVVFTVGSAFIACGFAGEAQPRHILSLQLHEVRVSSSQLQLNTFLAITME